MTFLLRCPASLVPCWSSTSRFTVAVRVDDGSLELCSTLPPVFWATVRADTLQPVTSLSTHSVCVCPQACAVTGVAVSFLCSLSHMGCSDMCSLATEAQLCMCGCVWHTFYLCVHKVVQLCVSAHSAFTWTVSRLWFSCFWVELTFLNKTCIKHYLSDGKITCMYSCLC